jgi:hypothetical protein
MCVGITMLYTTADCYFNSLLLWSFYYFIFQSLFLEQDFICLLIFYFSSFHTGTGPLILCPYVKSAYAGSGVDACSIVYKKRKNYKEVMLGTKIHLLIYNPFQAGYVSLLSSVRQATRYYYHSHSVECLKNCNLQRWASIWNVWALQVAKLMGFVKLHIENDLLAWYLFSCLKHKIANKCIRN